MFIELSMAEEMLELNGLPLSAAALRRFVNDANKLARSEVESGADRTALYGTRSTMLRVFRDEAGAR